MLPSLSVNTRINIWNILIVSILFSVPIYADQVASQSFKGINSNENPLIIGPEFAADAQNVDVTPGGRSVKKRPGYGVYKTLTSVQGLHGGYHFFDSTGNDVQVWGSSVSLYGIVSDGTATRLVSSATAAATWDCADTQGNAYCVNSSRDAYIKTAGATINWYTTPLGTMVEATPDRIAVAGVSGTANTIYISGSNAFTNFTAGPLTTDPFTEVIAAPGSKLTHLRWGCGKLLWWKDQSFGYFTFEDQFTAQIKIVSDNIGTFDNTSAMDPGGSVWFRGQDGHIYEYDCSGLIKQSIEISPFIQASGRRTSNYWTQTSQSDFESGSIVPTGQLSTTISPGDVTVSSYTVFESTGNNFSSGASTYTSIIAGSGMLFNVSSFTINNNDFETNSGIGGSPTNWTASGTSAATEQSVPMDTCGTVSPKSGSWLLQDFGAASGAVHIDTASVIDAGDSSYINRTPFGGTTVCPWTLNTIAGTNTANRSIKIELATRTGTVTSGPFIGNGNSIAFYYGSGVETILGTARWQILVDTFMTTGFSTASYTSQVYDTGFTSSTMQLTAIAPGQRSPSFIVWTTTTSTNRTWFQTLTSSGTNAVGNRYVKVSTSMTWTMADTSTASLTSLNFLTRSSGTYYSAVKNAPNLSAWSTFNPNYADNGGSHAFYVRASSWSFPVSYLTPSWTSTTAGSVLTISTGTYFQVRDDFVVPSGTNTPTLTDFTVNWFDGSASDQAYGLYFDNAIWFSVAYGVGVSSNTYIFKRDLINDGWTVYNFGAGGMLTQNNHLFFGDVAASGNIFQYGSGTSDNGNSINAYWQTKNFAGTDPFLENSYTQLDSYWARNANQSATVAYTVNGSTTSASYSVLLSSTTQSIIRSKKNLPTGTNGSTINLKFSDTSTTSQWELFLFRLMFTPYPWKPG